MGVNRPFTSARRSAIWNSWSARTDEQKGAGYSLRYQTKDLSKADVYVYDMGIRNLPDGVAFTGTRISDTFLLSHRGHFLKSPNYDEARRFGKARAAD